MHGQLGDSNQLELLRNSTRVAGGIGRATRPPGNRRRGTDVVSMSQKGAYSAYHSQFVVLVLKLI